MEPFFVLPSESLLIGLCLGRYLQYEGCEGHTFPCVVQSWVQPFVPPTWPLLTYAYVEKDFEEIERDFGDLMRHNECNETFDLGRSLAVLWQYARTTQHALRTLTTEEFANWLGKGSILGGCRTPKTFFAPLKSINAARRRQLSSQMWMQRMTLKSLRCSPRLTFCCLSTTWRSTTPCWSV